MGSTPTETAKKARHVLMHNFDILVNLRKPKYIKGALRTWSA